MAKKFIGIILGLSLVVSLAAFFNTVTEDFENKRYKTEQELNKLERKMMYIISDKNYNGKLDESEMYQLGLELKVIDENEKISDKELTNRIKDASISEVKNYIDKYSKKD